MTPFAVEWTADAEVELARLWLTAEDRAAVTAAQARIDRYLGSDPAGTGRHLAEGLWSITVPPLVVLYAIDAPRKVVEAVGVRWVNPSL